MGVDGAVIQLATRCVSADEFVERFARFASETDVVVPAVADVSVGTSGRFEIRLKDQSVIMAGRCEVTEVLPMADAPGAPAAPTRPARALMRLRLIEMDAHSTGIHLRLTERRASAVKPPPAPAPPSAPAASRPLSVRSLSIVRTPPPRTVAPATAMAPPLPSRSPTPSTTPAPSPMNATAAAAPPTNVRAAAPPQLVRSVPMPTLIGVPAPVVPRATTAAAATAAATTAAATTARTAPATTAAAAAAPSAWEIETTEVSKPRQETRVPGAAFTLPANPLSDLDGADLASFIELKLLEIEGVDSAAIRIAQPADTAAPPMPDPATSSPPGPAGRWTGRLEQARRIARRYGPYASVLVIGLVAGLWLRSGAKVAPVVAPPTVVSPSEIVQPQPPPVAAPAPTLAAKIPPAGRAECVARVTTKPAGAAVFWGDVSLGPSPIENAPVHCGNAVVTFKHERYADLTRTITAERGRSAIVSERLARPPAKVTVTSSPPGARIKLNRQPFGEAPRKISTLRFERVRIDASLPGHQPWSKTFYMKEAETTVAVMLTPVPKPNARRAPAAHK